MSQFTVDIDTGGTFTDGFFTQGGKYETVKVDTTPHDLTVCFNQCIAEGARRFGFENVGDFLLQTKTIRLSTTVGTNSLIQRTGPKLGLIVTEGFDRSLYQEKNPVLNFLVEPELVVGIRGKVAEDGSISVEVDEDEVRSATKKIAGCGRARLRSQPEKTPTSIQITSAKCEISFKRIFLPTIWGRSPSSWQEKSVFGPMTEFEPTPRL